VLGVAVEVNVEVRVCIETAWIVIAKGPTVRVAGQDVNVV